MKQRILIWIVIILLIVLLAGGGIYFVLLMRSEAAGLPSTDTDSTTQIAVARQGDLIVFASGTGELVALDETPLKFNDNGTLIELLVSVGDQVSEGDVLARLQVNKTDVQLTADIADAELALIKAQQALDALYQEVEMNAAQALIDLEAAREALESVQDHDLEVAQAMQAVAAAEEAIEDAEMMLYIHNSSPSEDDIYTAYASLLFKEKTLNELEDEVARLEYERLQAKTKDMRKRIQEQLNQKLAKLYNAQIAYEEAFYRYETIDDPADPLDLNLAQAQMDTAQAQLDQANLELAEAQMGASAAELAMAEASLAEAQAEWERWKDGPDPDDVLIAVTLLEVSQLNMELAAQESLVVDLAAPMDGKVMDIYAAVNQVIEGDRILTLADTSQPLVEIYLDETDYQNAVTGSRVEVIFDALPDQTFSGALVDIAPELVRESNTQVVQGRAVLDDGALSSSLVVLPVGLNAAVDVIAGEATNAILVPIEALQETGSGDYIVHVQTTSGFETREVTVGLMDFISAEITSGLEVGETIAIEDVEAN